MDIDFSMGIYVDSDFSDIFGSSYSEEYSSVSEDSSEEIDSFFNSESSNAQESDMSSPELEVQTSEPENEGSLSDTDAEVMDVEPGEIFQILADEINDPNETNDEQDNVSPVINTETNATSENILTQNKEVCTTPSLVKRSRTSISPGGSDDDGQVCSICFESWTTSGRHRIVSLKCGHLYGHSCIDKWLKGQGSRCPQCNAPAKRTDFRTIFAKNLKVLDTSERDSALKMLEKEKEMRRRAELEVAQIKVKYQMVVQECERVKKELMEQKQWIQAVKATNKLDKRDMQSSQISSVISLVLEKTLDLCKDGGCRVLTSCDILNMLIVSQPSNNNLFPGYGIKKISTMDFRISEFFSLHQKPIKDIAFHKNDTLVLTASLDKTVKLTNVLSNSVVQSYSVPLEAWSCVWSRDDPNQFFAGLRNGTIFQFDTRMTSNYVCQLPAVGAKSPVMGLQYIQKQFNSGSSLSGLLSGQLSTCCLYEMNRESDYKLHPLPLEGSFTSLSYEPSTGHILLSCRPSAKHASVTHMLCELALDTSNNDSDVGNVCSCNIVQSFSGGDSQVQISKSSLFLHPRDESCILACVGDEKAQAALIWDACNGERLQQLKVNDPPVLDVQFFRLEQNHFIGTLTEKTLRLYRCVNI